MVEGKPKMDPKAKAIALVFILLIIGVLAGFIISKVSLDSADLRTKANIIVLRGNINLKDENLKQINRILALQIWRDFSDIFTIVTIFICINILHSQEELLSAKTLLEKLSESFKIDIRALKAEIRLVQGNTTSTGVLYFKNPQKIRINFTEPPNQVICSNGYELWVYIPYLNIVLHQDILERERIKDYENDEKINKENKEKKEIKEPEIITNPILLNPVGLDKFLTEYSIEYHETKEKINYKDNTKVYKLKLIRWRSTKHGFNVIYLIIQENGIIRKVSGVTASYKQIILELDKIELNTNISDLKFNYEPPAHTSTVDDFINK